MGNFKSACLSKKHGKAEIITFILYVLGISVMEWFHEPWFDEAQAWQIARYASIKEILFQIPHYEGHPQLWHLVLVPFAKLGAPYELSLFLVNAAFMISSIALILWRSPFPKAVRCLIPFNYFMFYQFGVISRPYCMLLFAFLLTAIFYQTRNKTPVRCILSLSFMCLTSAYGILFAGAFCMLWTWEIFQEYRKSSTWGKVVRDIRMYLLFGILALAILLLLCVLPAEDCYYNGNDETLKDKLFPIIDNILLILLMPFDSVAGCVLNESSDLLTAGGLYSEALGALLFFVVLLLVLHTNQKKALFLVPFTLFMVFCIMVYYSVHHIGIMTMFFIFVFWQIWEDNGELCIPPLFPWIAKRIDSKLTLRFGQAVAVLLILASPVSAAASCYYDIRYTYGMKEIVNFIKDNHLEDRTFMCTWAAEMDMGDDNNKNDKGQNLMNSIVWDETLPAKDMPEIISSYPHICGIPATVLPYFDNNMFISFNAEDDCHYMKWLDTHEKTDEIYAQWRSQGLPDFIIGLVPLTEVYSEEELNGVTYYWVDTLQSGKIFKFYHEDGEWKVYIRADLLDEYPQFEIQKYATILNPDLTQ